MDALSTSSSRRRLLRGWRELFRLIPYTREPHSVNHIICVRGCSFIIFHLPSINFMRFLLQCQSSSLQVKKKSGREQRSELLLLFLLPHWNKLKRWGNEHAHTHKHEIINKTLDGNLPHTMLNSISIWAGETLQQCAGCRYTYILDAVAYGRRGPSERLIFDVNSAVQNLHYSYQFDGTSFSFNLLCRAVQCITFRLPRTTAHSSSHWPATSRDLFSFEGNGRTYLTARNRTWHWLLFDSHQF